MERARSAGPRDTPRLIELGHQAVAELAARRGGAELTRSVLRGRSVSDHIRAALLDPDAELVAGDLDGALLGVGLVRVPAVYDDTRAEVELLYIEPEARAVGLGEALMEAMSDWAVSRGCTRIDATALPGNREAKAFFETNGMVARALVMSRHLIVPLQAGPHGERDATSHPGSDRSRVVPPGVSGGERGVAGTASAAEANRPQLCVGAIALDADRLLMVRRGRGAAQGRWSVPGGRVEVGETVAEAVVRELAEETGLEGVSDGLVGWVELPDGADHYVVLDFAVTVLSEGDPLAGDDAAEVAWVPLAEVTDLALTDGLAEFLHEHGILPTIT